MPETKIQRIRKRVTYQMWADIQQMLYKNDVKPRPQIEIMFKMWDVLDSRNGWHSERNAGLALESLDQLCRDAKLGSLLEVMRDIAEFKVKAWISVFSNSD